MYEFYGKIDESTMEQAWATNQTNNNIDELKISSQKKKGDTEIFS